MRYIIVDITKTNKKLNKEIYFVIGEQWVFSSTLATHFKSAEEAMIMLQMLQEYGVQKVYSEIKGRDITKQYEIRAISYSV